jgi:hypothetical protein
MSIPADSLSTPEAPGDAAHAADHAHGNSLAGRVIRRLLRAAGSPPVQVRLWNGDCLQADNTAPVASVRIADRATLWRILRDPQMAVADSYCSGHLDIDGDLVEFMNASYAAMARTESRSPTMPSSDPPEHTPDPIFDTSVGSRRPADLRKVYQIPTRDSFI